MSGTPVTRKEPSTSEVDDVQHQLSDAEHEYDASETPATGMEQRTSEVDDVQHGSSDVEHRSAYVRRRSTDEGDGPTYEQLDDPDAEAAFNAKYGIVPIEQLLNVYQDGYGDYDEDALAMSENDSINDMPDYTDCGYESYDEFGDDFDDDFDDCTDDFTGLRGRQTFSTANFTCPQVQMALNPRHAICAMVHRKGELQLLSDDDQCDFHNVGDKAGDNAGDEQSGDGGQAEKDAAVGDHAGGEGASNREASSRPRNVAARDPREDAAHPRAEEDKEHPCPLQAVVLAVPRDPYAQSPSHVGAVAATWRADGEYLAALCEDERVRLWTRHADYVAVLSPEMEFATFCQWSKSGSLLAVGNRSMVTFWNVDARLKEGERGEEEEVEDRQEEEDGDKEEEREDNKDVDNEEEEEEARVTEAKSDQPLFEMKKADHVLHFDTAVSSLVWRDDEEFATANSDNDIQLWRLGSTQPYRLFRGHQAYVYGLAWDPSGLNLASCSHDTTVKVWSPHSDSCLADLRGHTDIVQSVAWSPARVQPGVTGSPQLLASSSWDCTIRLWDFQRGGCLAVLHNNDFTVSYCDPSLGLAAASPEQEEQEQEEQEQEDRAAWDTTSQEEDQEKPKKRGLRRRSLDKPPMFEGAFIGNGMDFSADGRYLLSSPSRDTEAHLWRVDLELKPTECLRRYRTGDLIVGAGWFHGADVMAVSSGLFLSLIHMDEIRAADETSRDAPLPDDDDVSGRDGDDVSGRDGDDVSGRDGYDVTDSDDDDVSGSGEGEGPQQ